MNALRRHATAIVLVVAAVALGAWLWVDRNAVTEGERKRRVNSVFSAWRRDELARIEIVHDDETIVLERDPKADSAWRMTAPRAGRADQAAVERLTTTLEFASVARKVDPGAPLGLEHPRASGAITMGGLVLRFALGAPSPRPEGSAYFRVEGEPPVVVSRELADALLAPGDTYRDRTVVPYLSLELSRFEVTRPGGGFALERLDDRSFKVADLGVLAGHDAVDAIWAALADMRAEAFPKDADADRLTASPKLTIRMIPKDAAKPPAELVVGDACPGLPNDVVVLRKAPTRVAACAPAGVVAALSVAPSSFVETRAFTIRPDELEELRLEWLGDAPKGAPKAIEIARKGFGFHMREPADRDLDAPEVDAATALVTRMLDARATSAHRDGTTPAPVARARVRFGGDREETIELGSIDGAEVVARRALDGALLDLTPALALRFVPRETSLRPRTLVGDARRVVRVLLRCGAPQELVDAGAGLRLVDPRGYDTDGSVTQLASAFTRGKVDAWVADRDVPGVKLAPDGCRVVFSFDGGNDPKTVVLGDPESDAKTSGVYGRIEGAPAVFVAPRALRELASRWYVSRAALRVPAEAIESVKVVRGARAPADPAALRDAAASLFADGVASVGKKKELGGEDLVVDVALAEGGPPRRIACGPAQGGERRCATPSVDAVFDVAEPRLAPFLGAVDAGASRLARDAAPR